MLRLGRRCRHSCQMRRWSGHDAGRDSRKRLANFLRIRLLSSWQPGKSLHIARARWRGPVGQALIVASSRCSTLAKGFALDIPWSWRLREGGE
jgi:hypothetical protein